MSHSSSTNKKISKEVFLQKNIIVPAILLLLELAVSPLIFKGEAVYVLQWYFAWLLLSLCALPLTQVLFSSYPDKGYIFSKPLGLLISGGILWALSVFRILTFTRLFSFLCIVLCFVLSFGIYLYRKKSADAKKDTETSHTFHAFSLPENLPVILTIECLFLMIFMYWCFLKGSNAAAFGTEKYMDYGFMMTLSKSGAMPPSDLWYSGNPINYYYLGHYFSTFLAKLSGVSISYGYNLMLMSLPAIAFVECFCIVRTLLVTFQKNQTNSKQWLPAAGGIIAATANTIAGNMHYVIYGMLHLAGKPDGSEYMYYESTRFIGHNPDIDDKTIHEFPSYSFCLGDLHAHVINIIFVFLVVAILLSYVLQRQEKFETAHSVSFAKFTDILKASCSLEVILVGIIIGIFQGTNFWDFPIYFVVAGSVILFTNIIVYDRFSTIFKLTLFQGILVMATAQIAGIPFHMYFDMISSQVQLVKHRSAFYQLMILWGLPVFVFLLFLIYLFVEKQIKKIHPADLFIAAIGLCAFGLLLIPEVIYVVDIYGEAYSRSNTMFKLTYQAYMLFGLCFGYLFIRLIFFSKKYFFRIASSVCLVLFFLTLGYFPEITKSLFGGVMGQGYETLDASAFLKEYDPEDPESDITVTDPDSLSKRDDAEAIDWINENITTYPTVILEINGDSYTYENRISVFTGQPTVLGWGAHEWLWRSKDLAMPQEQIERQEDVRTIYSSYDEETVRSLLQKYNVSYIVVGNSERTRLASWNDAVNEDLLKSLGEIVFESDYNVDSPIYIIKL